MFFVFRHICSTARIPIEHDTNHFWQGIIIVRCCWCLRFKNPFHLRDPPPSLDRIFRSGFPAPGFATCGVELGSRFFFEPLEPRAESGSWMVPRHLLSICLNNIRTVVCFFFHPQDVCLFLQTGVFLRCCAQWSAGVCVCVCVLMPTSSIHCVCVCLVNGVCVKVLYKLDIYSV